MISPFLVMNLDEVRNRAYGHDSRKPSHFDRVQLSDSDGIILPAVL